MNGRKHKLEEIMDTNIIDRKALAGIALHKRYGFYITKIQPRLLESAILGEHKAAFNNDEDKEVYDYLHSKEGLQIMNELGFGEDWFGEDLIKDAYYTAGYGGVRKVFVKFFLPFKNPLDIG